MFIHISALPKGVTSLNEGQEVSFDVDTDKKGLKAANVRIGHAAIRPDPNMQSKTPVATLPTEDNLTEEVFPYDFCRRQDKRIDNRELKQKPEQFHDKLNENCYGIAFEIEWTTLTPTAVNPCSDPDPSVGASPQGCKEGEYAGYNKRWLMIDNKLAISPFTVKSAIANGFASIMGGCYRVVSGITKHDDVKDDNYPYTGKYKRYRVAMSGESLPGIVKDISKVKDGYKITIQPVKEFYYSGNLSSPLGKYSNCRVRENVKHKNYVDFLTGGSTTLNYFGPYSFGMQLELKPGNLEKNHTHRFYEEVDESFPIVVTKENFENKDSLKNKVYMGVFRRMPPSKISQRFYDATFTGSIRTDLDKFYYLRDGSYKKKGTDSAQDREIFGLFKKAHYDYDPRETFDGNEWYEVWPDEDKLQNELIKTWIYYERFGDKGVIGKNFLFKAVFSVDDAIPDNQHVCNNPDELCPRCSMFGMTGKSEDENTPQGFRGRFKSATLVSDNVLGKPEVDKNYSVPELTKIGNQYRINCKNIPVLFFKHNDKDICRQYLLPLQGQPKANKRDVNGYYESDTGNIKGAKYYLHASCNIKELIEKTDRNTTIGTPPMPYTHNLRNFAMVCNDKEGFTGTVGAENCTPEEIAALVILLNSSEANHGFKIGLGKAFGMGSIKSSINRVWIRSKDNYDKWNNFDKLTDFLYKYTSIQKTKDDMVKVLDLPNQLYKEREDITVPKIKTEYPAPGSNYWRDFNSHR